MESSIALPVFESDDPRCRPVEIVTDAKSFDNSMKVFEHTFLKNVLRRNDTKGQGTKVRPRNALKMIF